MKLLVAERKQCEKAFLRAREIAKQYEEQARHKEMQRQTHPASPPANTPHGDSGHMAHNGGSRHGQYGNAPSMSATAVYYVHYDDIRKHMNIQDYSRLDSMIALRMRATGHSPQAVMDAICQCAPSIRTKEGRDWQKYAERTANYAFGVAGDVALRKYERYVGQWEKAEKEVQNAQNIARLRR